jgi:hypothetical protein
MPLPSRILDLPVLRPVSALAEEQKKRSALPRVVKDTMSDAPQITSESYKTTKPKLGTGPIHRFIGLSDRLYLAGEKSADLQVMSLDLEEKKLSEITMAHAQKLSEAAKKAQNVGVWSYLQKIGTAVLSTVSIFLGIELAGAATTATIGAALVAVGIFGVAHLAFHEAGFWDWVAEKIAQDNEDLKNKIRNLVPFILGLLVNGAQLAAFGALPYYAGMELSTKILFLAQLFSNTTTIVSAVGGQITEAMVSRAKAEALALQGDMSVSRHEVERITQGIEHALSSQSLSFKAAQQIVDLTTEANQQIISTSV